MTLVLLNENDSPDIVRRVPQGEARREHALRDLIYEQPTIVPVHDLDPSYGRLFTVARELSIPGVGFIDNLLADEWGRLVVIECKLWRNPQARREVVGQILDYAGELGRYSYEDLQRQISIATRQRGNVLYDLACEAGSTLEEAAFVDRVTRDLTAGRFLLLVVGDGITENTRRIGEFLSGQAGLTFDFGMIEFAEYRFTAPGGSQRTIMHPRVLAQTTVIERHVIRSAVPGMVVDAVTPQTDRAGPGSAPTEAGLTWRTFFERFLEEVSFDDPGQPLPKIGGTGWIKVPLPDNLYANVYRSSSQRGIGAQVRFTDVAGRTAFDMLMSARAEIDAEFAAAGLASPEWHEGDTPLIALTCDWPVPWDDAAGAGQRAWMARVANQFVNSLRPRLELLPEPVRA